MIPGTTVQPDPDEVPPPLPKPSNPRAISPPNSTAFQPRPIAPAARFPGGGGASRSKTTKKKVAKSKSNTQTLP